MVVVNDTTVGTNRNVNACFLVVLITSCCNLDKSGSLSAADTLCLTSDSDRTATDTYLDEVCTCISEETEAVAVNNVTCADLYGVAVVFAYPLDGALLPYGVAFGGVNANHVTACCQQSGTTFCVVAGVDTCAYHIALLIVQHFVGVFLVACVVLAEYEVHQVAVSVHDGQGVELVIPDNVVGFL